MLYVLAQFSASTVHPSDPVRAYYLKAWRKLPGYWPAGSDFLELPAWAADVAGALRPTGARIEFVSLHAGSADRIRHLRPAAVFGSVLDVNLEHWRRLAASLAPLPFYLGGYVSPGSFADIPNVVWLDSPSAIADVVPGAGPATPDYSIFAGQRCIPRLRLSTGCLYRCAFCTVPRNVTPCSFAAIARQVDSFRPLAFRYVYLDDKTFGQAETAELLPAIRDRILAYNPGFLGFIVQSTASEIVQHAETWYTWGVRVIELGVETLEADVLRQWRKPHGPAGIAAASAEVRRLRQRRPDLWLVPNLIFGYEHADYAPTLAWLARNLDVIPWINPYILCQYHDSKGEAAHGTGGTGDADEGSWDKSWLDDLEVNEGQHALEYALGLTVS